MLTLGEQKDSGGFVSWKFLVVSYDERLTLLRHFTFMHQTDYKALGNGNVFLSAERALLVFPFVGPNARMFMHTFQI